MRYNTKWQDAHLGMELRLIRTRFALSLGLWLTLAPALTQAAASNAPMTPSPATSLTTLTETSPLEATFQMGLRAFDEGDYAAAAKLLRAPAEHGHVGAQFTLGVMHATGKGIATDIGRAVQLWEAAGAQGHAASLFNLGVLYANGRGVEKDAAKARMYWHLAATSGDPSAQFHLGALAATGEGGPRNYQEAARWWRAAAAQGNQQAAEGLEILKAHGALPENN
jgi:uncharacterized protein